MHEVSDTWREKSNQMTPAGYSSLVLVGMCHCGIWKYTHTNYIFSTKCDPFIYQSAQFFEKFWAKSLDFSKIFLNLNPFWLKFGKILKKRPIHIPTFAFYKGVIHIQRGWFCYPCWRAIPVGPFVQSTPQGKWHQQQMIIPYPQLVSVSNPCKKRLDTC